MKVETAPERGRVSVVIAGYNCESFIEPTLASVLEQSYPRHAADGNGDGDGPGGEAAWRGMPATPMRRSTEIVFVDDGSTDGTRRVVEGFSPDVRYLQVPHGGVSAARNAGVRATNGQYVAFLDHDDLWAKDKIERQVAMMDAHPDLGLVFTRAKVTGDASHAPVIPPPGAPWEALFVNGIAQRDPAGLYARLLVENFVPYSSILARRVAMPIGGFREDLRYSEDHDFLLKMSELKRFGFLEETLTTYTIRPGRATSRMADLRLEDVAILADNLHRNPWLMRREGAAMRRRERALLKEAGYWLMREGRGAEARPLLRKAWRKSPFDVKLPAYLLASMTATSRG